MFIGGDQMTIGNGKKGVISKTGLRQLPVRVEGIIPDTFSITVEMYPSINGELQFNEIATLSSATTFNLSKYPVMSVSKIEVDGTELIEGTDYTIDKVTGVITFTTAQTGSLAVQYSAIPDIDTQAYASQSLAGDGTNKRKTFVFDATPFDVVVFIFSSDSMTEFDITVS